MNEVYFDNVIQIGKLYLDYIFYEFESEPILFSCIDDKKELYLCLCSEIRYGQKWVITKCELSTLKALVDEKMDIASAFLLKNELVIIDMDLQGNERSYVIKSSEVDRLDLPSEGMYIKDNKEDARNYLWNKECKRLLEKIEAGMNMNLNIYTEVAKKTIDVLCESVETCIDVFFDMANRQMDMLGRSSEQSMMVEQVYSIEVKEKYDEVIDSIELSGDDGVFQAA